MSSVNSGVFKFGTAFKNGKLYKFDKVGVSVIRFWPQPAAWRKTRCRRWKALRPHIYIQSMFPTPPDTSRESDPEYIAPSKSMLIEERCELAAVLTIPEHVREVAGRFPSDWQFQLLSMIARCDGALELAASNPALAAMLAANRVFHKPSVKQPMRSARTLLLKKRRDICGWLGFPAKDAVVRCLAKVAHRALSFKSLLYLRQACNDAGMLQRLGFISRINADVIRVASDPRLLHVCTNRLLDELGKKIHESSAWSNGEVSPRVAFMLRDVLRMLPENARPHFDTVEQIVQQHNHDIEQLRLHGKDTIPFAAFPDPPLPGLPRIVEPLSDTHQLQEWGAINHNCCLSYWRQIVEDRNVYIYKIETPDGVLATLSLCLKRGKWRLGELKEACNREPSWKLIELVESWLRSVQRFNFLKHSSDLKDVEPTLFDGLNDDA